MSKKWEAVQKDGDRTGSQYYRLFKGRLYDTGYDEMNRQGGLEFYDEMIPAMLAHTCAGQFPHTCEVDLLEEFDAARGTEFVRTLYLYLACERNTVATAAALYLHRSSTHTKLEKIRNLIDADLDNPNVRLKLLIDLNERAYAKSDQRSRAIDRQGK